MSWNRLLSLLMSAGFAILAPGKVAVAQSTHRQGDRVDSPAGRVSVDRSTLDGPVRLRLASFQEGEGQAADAPAMTEEGWEISGPVFLRSVDPEPPGEVVIKNIFEWATTKGGGSDDFEYELEIEWGVIEDHELIFEVPFELGDGRVDGNGDLTLGWHWRLWKEHDGWPAFGMRNYVRIPTGIDSSGVDYELRGLFTKTVIPETMRLHLNPFAATINGNNEEDARPFHWGIALGFDYRLSEDILLIGDYIYSNGEEERTRDNHEAELGIDWTIAPHQELGIAVDGSLDGDSNGPTFGAKVSYMISFGP